MERMTRFSRGTLVLLTALILASCQDMVLRDTVVQKVVEAQNPPAKDGRLTLEYNAAGQAFGSTFNAPTAKAGTSPVLHFTIRNTGLTNLTGNAVSVLNPTGTGGTFAVTSQPASPIVPGGASNFDLTFNAAATTGTAGATLQIVSNDVSHPTFTVTLAAKADGTAPTGSVSINGGAAVTNNLSFALTLSGADTGGASLAQVQFSTDGSNYSAPEAFSATKAFAFPSEADGIKTVYVKLLDSVGNVSAATTDTITLDRTKPTASFSVTNLASGGANQGTNVTVNLNEAMQTATFTTSSVRLLLNGTPVGLQTGTNGFSIQSSTQVILRPASNLMAATTYTVQVTTAALDTAGNAANAYSSTFTTGDDVYENTYAGTTVGTGYDNNSVTPPVNHAFNLTSSADQGNFKESFWSQDTGTGGLAVLANIDNYKLTVPSGTIKLHVRVYYTNSTAALDSNVFGESARASDGSHTLFLSMNHNSAGLGAMTGIIMTNTTNLANDIRWDIDFQSITSGNPVGDYNFMIAENSGNYSNPWTYNLVWYAEPGI